MTAGQYREIDFEEAIERHLVEEAGWIRGVAEEFDRELAIDRRQLFAWLEASQPEVMERLRAEHEGGGKNGKGEGDGNGKGKGAGDGLEEGVVRALARALDKQGTLGVLRRGFKFFGRRLQMAVFRPAHGLNPEVLERYAANRLVVTRQVKFAPGREWSVDLVLGVNGVPVATVELKNAFTGQRCELARKQYVRRDWKQPLFRFKARALVHFAVDTDEVWYATRLAGEGTYFLPFNRGRDGGAGNPPATDEGRYPVSYLWEEVWQRDSFLDVVGRFMFVEEEVVVDVETGKKRRKETVIFPRYHQLDCVRKVEAAARAEGAGWSYLIQHSAGSGKSKSIAWLAHRLQSLHAGDEKVFDSVVIITDRRVLDKQLRRAVFQLEHKDGVVLGVEKGSKELAEALESGVPIITTTLQKFPFVTEKIEGLPGRRYAIIVDEAHSSQSGESAKQMKGVLAASNLETAGSGAGALEAAGEAALAAAGEAESGAGGAWESEEDWQDEVVRIARSRGRQKNLSFFAFTATPKAKTLEVFGRVPGGGAAGEGESGGLGSGGLPVPFHLYSMRQAIEERFILDVLKHYTTYKTYYRLVKAIEEDPRVNKKKATSALARFMSLHPHNVAQKVEIIVEHFRQKVRRQLGGKAKAMVVTPSRLHAVRYFQAFDEYLSEHAGEDGYDDIGVLVAFSGKVIDPDTGAAVEYTEVGLNKGIPEKGLTEEFATDAYQVLVVANKYQTGFDQPLLTTMYVDRRLSGVQAVQTLSRLNRSYPGKQETFILDFANEAEHIREAFQPFYEQTMVAETTDHRQLYDLQAALEDAQVFTWDEVNALCRLLFKPGKKYTDNAHAALYYHVKPAEDRFRALDEEAQERFRGALKAFVGLYAFVSQVMPFTDVELEKLYTYGRLLYSKLPRQVGDPVDIDGKAALEFYRIEKISEGNITLAAGEEAPVYGPTAVGTRKDKDEQEHLSRIIDILNERYEGEFTESDQLFFEQVITEAREDREVRQRAKANPYDNFSISFRETVRNLMIDRMDANAEIVSRYLNDEEFRKVAYEAMAKQIFGEARASGE
ncbi:MAG: type I restriction endonuclease [bacterium]